MHNDTDLALRRLAPRRGEAGFTLIELLMVVTIVGILAAIAVPVWLDQRVDAFDAAAKSDLHTAAVQAAIQAQDGDEVSTVDDPDSPHTDGVSLDLIAYDRAVGYCLSAHHEGSPNVWYWDSLRPGVQQDGTTCSVPRAGTDSGGTASDTDVERDCNNGVNKGNLNRCEEFPGQGRRGSANR